MTRVVLVNPFDKIPGDQFRDQRYTFLYRGLREHRVEVTWISSDFHHWSHSRRSYEQLPVSERTCFELVPTPMYRRNVGLRRLLSHLILSLRASQRLKRLPRPDLVLCVGPVEMMYLIVRWGRRQGIPVIVDVLDLWPDLFVKGFPRPLRWLGRAVLSPWFVLSRWTYSMADQVTAVSRTYAEWARTRAKRLDRTNFSHYYLGCEVRQPAASRAPQDRLRALFAGQFGFNYDLETVLAVARRLWEQGHRNIEFVLAGDGYKRAELMKQAGDLPNIRFTGWIAWELLPELARECNLGLSCYTREATQSVPTKIFDYMALGLAIANSIPGEAAELIADARIGWQYEPEDPGSLSALLVELGQRIKDVIEAGQRARQAYERRFDASRIYEKMIDELILPAARPGDSTGG